MVEFMWCFIRAELEASAAFASALELNVLNDCSSTVVVENTLEKLYSRLSAIISGNVPRGSLNVPTFPIIL